MHASLDEQAAAGGAWGYYTAIIISPDGALAIRTHKSHMPMTAGYYEDTYFKPGPAVALADAYGALYLCGGSFRFPTCWDQRFPELARVCSPAGAEVLVCVAAIGSEPHHRDLDTRPLWQQVIVANRISSGLFRVPVNRYGAENGLLRYGCSFVSDPPGRMLAKAPRDQAAVRVSTGIWISAVTG